MSPSITPHVRIQSFFNIYVKCANFVNLLSGTSSSCVQEGSESNSVMCAFTCVELRIWNGKLHFFMPHLVWIAREKSKCVVAL
jgi:hypothetical protein